MTTAAPTSFSRTELAVRLRAVDPAVFLVPPRILRRVGNRCRSEVKPTVFLPGCDSQVIERDSLLKIVFLDELGLASNHDLAETLILLPQPRTAELGPADLVRYWRLLFRARVQLAVQRRLASFTQPELRGLWLRLGVGVRDEIELILQQEKYLPQEGDLRLLLIEFVALYLELRYFAPTELPLYFPAQAGEEAIEQLLGELVNAPEVFQATRPAGAPEPEERPKPSTATSNHTVTPSVPMRMELLQRADRVAATGNLVRAALLRQRAGTPAIELEPLVQRLAAALPGIKSHQWQEALQPLPELAVGGYWSPAALFLYDLQKVCTDSERELYHIQLVRWALSLGSGPLRRPVPLVNRVAVQKDLRSARRRLDTIALPEEQYQRLAQVLDEGLEVLAADLRNHCRPLVQQALAEAKLLPASLVERVSRDKLVEELLDQLVEHGFLNFGQVRDAVARNQLKLEDVHNPVELLLEDKLLRLDRALAQRFEGVYHRGEIYLRWLQTVSSMAFGTGLGRALVRYLALPFGGAYVILAGLYYLLEEVHIHVHLIEPWLIGTLGMFLFLLLHVPPFRRAVAHTCLWTGQALHTIFVDFPLWLGQLPPVRAILDHPLARLLRRSLVKPLLLALLIFIVFWLSGADGETTWLVSGATWLLLVVLVNTRLGRDIDETIDDEVIRIGQQVRLELVPALLQLIIQLFRWLKEQFERLLYTVDEWLRFRKGESRLMLAVKAVAGLFWSVIAYLIRMLINLIIEPSINPIKHFPVVTIAGKLLIPLIPVVVSLASLVVDPALAILAGTLFILGAPGIFGFLVWELKENWKLYRANRAPTLRPVLIGSHGETMLRLLRPGFHSGTVPGLYRKLRRAARRGNTRRIHRLQHDLHHVAESVQHFIERELVHLLAESPRWQATLHIEDIQLSPGRIRITLAGGSRHVPPLRLVFEHHSGWLLLRQTGPDWPDLRPQQNAAVHRALCGVAHLAAVHLLDERLRSLLPTGTYYGIQATALRVLAADLQSEGRYPWPEEGDLYPEPKDAGWPTLPRQEVMFHEQGLAWDKWEKEWSPEGVES